MAEYTEKYGAITSIVDNATSHSVKDSTGTEFTFEIAPINISEEEINQVYISIGNSKVWFIHYTTSFKEPTEDDIKKALNDGLLIKIYKTCQILDNYGIMHNLEYDKIQNKYIIKINQQIKYNAARLLLPLSNQLIYRSKLTNDIGLLSGITNSDRIFLSDIFSEIDKLKEIIKVQEDRIKLLEQK
jgi:hypothetical protein